MLFFSVLKRKTALNLIIVFHVLVSMSSSNVQGKCRTGCDLALASYYVSEDASNLTYISTIFNIKISEILPYNPQIENSDYIATDGRIKVPFSCDCLNGDFLGHTFTYITQFGDTYDKVAQTVFANLTTEDWVHRFNIYDDTRNPINSPINVTVNCSCGDGRVSKDYGLFTTYPLRQRENLSTVAEEAGVSTEILIRYNPEANISAESGIVFAPAKDLNGTFPPLKIRAAGIRRGVIAGIFVAVVAGTLLFLVCLYVRLYKKKRVVQALFLKEASHQEHYIHSSGSTLKKNSETAAHFVSHGLPGITVNKSVEFSYDELANATDNFSMANKIGEGGFGSVYYAEIRGEKAAIKKMEKKAVKEFLAELKVLTNVHHLNLVRLIGYCMEGSLFVVYEFMENGNLSHHLRGSERDPIPWPARVQIALDSALGLEYIHEHTVPVYVHRDIKSANILLDKNFRAKVGDFGLTKRSEYGNFSFQSRLVGTFGYIPPEGGDVSPKVDVYAFGVVLYELISAKEAVIKSGEDATEKMTLVALFKQVLSQPDSKEDLRKLVDPKLGDNYPMDEISKIAHLAKACTKKNPQHRPSMRSVVVELTTLSSSTEDSDIRSSYGNKASLNLISGS